MAHAIPQEQHLMVAAIDFGTTYSGYAFSFRHDFEADPLKVSANNWTAGSAGLVSLKTPTTVLLNDKEEFEAFGYEAEDKYTELADDDAHGGYHYFRRFKMMLFDPKIRLTRHTTIKSLTGSSLKAIDVFAHAIRYLKKHLTDTLETRATGVLDGDIHWVLTVPAIWDDPAKQFMREAAEMAGITCGQLTICLEPEAASMYCKYLPIEKMSGTEDGFAAFRPGRKYLVLDAGGGTVDITVHEVQKDQTLKELDKASGGAWGGTRVDQSFKEMMEELVTPAIMEQFALKHTADYIDMFRDFETKKRNVKEDSSAKITLKIPISLTELFEEETEEEISDAIKKSKYKKEISWVGDKLRISKDCFKGFFDAACNGIVSHVQKLLDNKNVRGTDNILMVGGFSESPLLQQTVRQAFPQCRIIIPQEPGLAVLKGAVLFGHKPKTISSRVAKFTYGVETYTNFDRHKHREEKKKIVEGKEKCADSFDKHVTCGDELTVDDIQSRKTYYPLYADQKKLSFKVFASSENDPTYTDDYGCRYLGTLTMDISDTTGKDREVEASLSFGGTELHVEAKETKKGKINVKTARFDFLDGEP
ncbi:hypothetical protein FSP39_007193 [Pinctada imbricata]|uniref:Uncharacterized protein n=1 Tax=Pinctada imbricata TaxID=66713 RepID=A0AA88YHR1_PINIB|nr:hypothetical protein FSP39_007193 [Pinctada imbricata]